MILTAIQVINQTQTPEHLNNNRFLTINLTTSSQLVVI